MATLWKALPESEKNVYRMKVKTLFLQFQENLCQLEKTSANNTTDHSNTTTKIKMVSAELDKKQIK